jgi:hypothetical protein
LQSVQYIDENGQIQFGRGSQTAVYTGSFVALDHYASFIQLNSSWVSTCNSGDPSCFSHLSNLASAIGSQQIDLTFTLTTGFIEFGWTNPSMYIAPDNVGVAAVPEPSTWAMLLLGFAGIVFMGRRRQRITAPSNCM